MPHRFFAVLAAMLAACGHGEPFVPGDYASNDPFNPPPFVRLTLNPARDVAPSWLPDGRIMYTMQRIDRSDLDLCLALQPGTGGAISRYLCPSTAPDDSINALLEGSASNDGRLAYVRQSARRFPFVPLTPAAQALV